MAEILVLPTASPPQPLKFGARLQVLLNYYYTKTVMAIRLLKPLNLGKVHRAPGIPN